MIVDFERERTLPAFVADVCIVGAGAAGIVLASQLMRVGKRVLLLESGGSKEDETFQQLNRSARTGQALKSVHAGRFRALGGTTIRWGGQIQEMQERDFDARPGIPGSGWPILRSTLTPYYERALEAEGLLPVLRTDEEVWRESGSAAPNLSSDLIPYFTRWCPEPNFARLYRDTLPSTNICVVLHATVCELMMNDAADAVLGLRCKNLAGSEHVFHAPAYVLCAGMIETIQLLLQPLEKGEAPWQKNGWLGRHVQSHIDYNSAKLVDVDRKRMEQVFPNVYLKRRKYQPKFRVSEERQRADETLNIAGAISFISLGSVERDVRQMKSAARNFLRGNWTAIGKRDTLPALRRLPILAQLAYSFYVSHRAYWPQDVTYWLRVHCEQEPLSASRITLSPERDAMGMFRTRIDWQVSPLEWKTIQRFTQMAQRALENAGLARLEPQQELAFEDGYRQVTFDDSYHWMGGTRMASSAADGVVDTDLKLHGVRNAYVCSASVYPTSGFANPVHTLLALAIRLADHLTAQPPLSETQQATADSAASPVDTQVRADA
ncbi:MAG TPA: GMC family oxidoreductase [Acidobacteriaceae bacterium]|nr:GMC family oxidoreductase [Acidobacteriaceae bacterium]